MAIITSTNALFKIQYEQVEMHEEQQEMVIGIYIT